MYSGISSVPKMSSDSRSRLKSKKDESRDCNQNQEKGMIREDYSRMFRFFDGKLQLRGSHFLVFRPETIPNNEQCEGCPNCLSWGYHYQASSCTSCSNLRLGAEASSWKRLAIHGVSTVMSWGNPLGFGCDEIKSVGDFHGPEEIRCWLILGRNQDFGSWSLSRGGKRKIWDEIRGR
jgi:hypothetical protein